MFNIRQLNQIFVNWLFWLYRACKKYSTQRIHSLSFHMLALSLMLWNMTCWKKPHSILGNRLGEVIARKSSFCTSAKKKLIIINNWLGFDLIECPHPVCGHTNDKQIVKIQYTVIQQLSINQIRIRFRKNAIAPKSQAQCLKNLSHPTSLHHNE